MQDRALCTHVLSVHQTGHAPERSDAVELLDAATLRSYIAKAKQFDPYIPEDLTGMQCSCYTALYTPNSSSCPTCTSCPHLTGLLSQ